MLESNKKLIEQVIKKEKWLKSDFVYAIHGMSYYNPVGFWPESYKKNEVITIFWELIDKGLFKNIASYTCFQNIEFTPQFGTTEKRFIY